MTEAVVSVSEVPDRVVTGNDELCMRAHCANVTRNTKYTPLTFIFRFLFEQFTRIMNIYFLFVAIMQLDSTLTPVNPITTWLPLLMTLGLAGVKEFFDDRSRAKADKEANERMVEVVQNHGVTQCFAKDLRVGMIVKVSAGQEVPADMLLLKTSHAKGLGYVMTANIDGESDLKLRKAPTETQELSEAEVLAFSGRCVCAAPNADISRFDSRLELGDRTISLSAENLLLQCVYFKNVEFAYAMVVYTGQDTKVARNKKPSPTKWTVADRLVNHQTTYVWLLQGFFVILLGTIGYFNFIGPAKDHWYLRWNLGGS